MKEPKKPSGRTAAEGVACHPATLARAVGEAEPVGHVLLDVQGRILWANAMLGRQLGLEERLLPGVRLADVMVLDSGGDRGLGARLSGGWRRVWLSVEGSDSRRGGLMAESSLAIDGLASGRLLSFIDIHATGQAPPPSLGDPVTGLPSTWVFEDRLQHAMQRADRLGQKLAIMILRLDRATRLLREQGESVVHRILQQISRRLGGVLRSEDSVTYLGHYRWGVLVEHPVDPERLQAAAVRCLEVMEAPFPSPALMTLSIGIVFYPDDGGTPDALLAAGRQAQRYAGPGGYTFLDRELKRQLADRAAFCEALQRALMEPERHFALLYQPIWGVRASRCVGVECLVRWRHPRRGWLLPEAFLADVQEMGQMGHLSRWMLRRVIEQRRSAVLGHALEGIELSVNIDASLLSAGRTDGGALDRTLREMQEDLAGLALEIDGRALVGLDETHGLILRRLTCAGVKLVADNLDGNMLILSGLSRLPVSGAKVKGELVATLGSTPSDAVLAGLAAALEALNIELTIVGIELAAQQKVAERYGISRVQGGRIAEPMTLDALADWFAAGAGPSG